MSASTLVVALQQRHAGDLFIPECKDGPSVGGMCRLDAWAMLSSWARPAFIGYEIKVSRGDFLNDKKIERYRPLVNQLYVVAPKGIVHPDELPEGVGLLQAIGGGMRLVTARKAPWRDVDAERCMDLLRYVLMWRVSVRPERFSRQEDAATYWRGWLAAREEDRVLGHKCSAALRRQVDERITKVEAENKKLKEQAETVQRKEALLQRYGLSDIQWLGEARGRERVRAVKDAIASPMLISQVEHILKNALRDASEAQHAFDRALNQLLRKEQQDAGD